MKTVEFCYSRSDLVILKTLHFNIYSIYSMGRYDSTLIPGFAGYSIPDVYPYLSRVVELHLVVQLSLG